MVFRQFLLPLPEPGFVVSYVSSDCYDSSVPFTTDALTLSVDNHTPTTEFIWIIGNHCDKSHRSRELFFINPSLQKLVVKVEERLETPGTKRALRCLIVSIWYRNRQSIFNGNAARNPGVEIYETSRRFVEFHL